LYCSNNIKTQLNEKSAMPCTVKDIVVPDLHLMQLYLSGKYPEKQGINTLRSRA
jgi:hypothetical protein